jgi:hypothetical protein
MVWGAGEGPEKYEKNRKVYVSTALVALHYGMHNPLTTATGQFCADTCLIRGTSDRRGGDEVNLFVNELVPLDQLDSRYTSGLIIRVDERTHGSDSLPKIHEIVRGYPGDRELQLILCLQDGSRVFLKSHRLRIDICAELRSRLDDLLGRGNLQVIPPAPQPPTAEEKTARERQSPVCRTKPGKSPKIGRGRAEQCVIQSRHPFPFARAETVPATESPPDPWVVRLPVSLQSHRSNLQLEATHRRW